MSAPPEDDTSVPAIVGEWLGLFKSIPGVGKAIARLVGGLGDAGAKIEHGIGQAGAAGMDIATAKAEDQAARIRGETKAREKVRAAMTNAAIRHLEATPEMGERALERFAGDLIRKQVNTEAVAVRALEHLSYDPPIDQKEEPEDDWLNIFSAHAERASSEFMREHWARVLSSEIRQPGSFSYSTLQMMSVVDPRLAKVIHDVCGWVIEGRFVPIFSHFERGERYDMLVQLQSIGFISLGHALYPTVSPEGKASLPCANYNVVGKFALGANLLIKTATLTLAGQEIFRIIDYTENEGLPSSLGALFIANGASGYTIEPSHASPAVS